MAHPILSSSSQAVGLPRKPVASSSGPGGGGGRFRSPGAIASTGLGGHALPVPLGNGMNATAASAGSRRPASASTSRPPNSHPQSQGARGGHNSNSSRGGGPRGGAGTSASSAPSSRAPHKPVVDEQEAGKRALKLRAYGPEVYSADEDSIRADWSMHYVNTGERPQNLLHGCELSERFAEYPKLAKLLSVHSALVKQHAHPPTYLHADLRTFHLPSLHPTKFDCILIDPPLEEYAHAYPSRVAPLSRLPPPSHGPSSEGEPARRPYWTWDEIAALPVPSIAANPGFIWLWVGSGRAHRSETTGEIVSGLDKGREILQKWGYRRCEDITWLRTNRKRPDPKAEPATDTLFTHTKEHCLMGIRGTVRRSTDGHFVHCNVDTDVIVWEGDETDPLRKPPELYNLIENFCMGTRRLELFGNARDARPGWLTIGLDDLPTPPGPEATSPARLVPLERLATQAEERQPEVNTEDEEHDSPEEERTFPTLLSSPEAVEEKASSTLAQGEDAEPAAQPYDKAAYDAHFRDEQRARGGNLVPTTSEVDALRPRSPGPPTSSALANRNMRASPSGQPGHLVHPLPALPPGMKVNPQGIGRHTNRSATPSASQYLEMQLMQERAAQQQNQERLRIQQQQQQQQQAQMQMQAQAHAQAQWMQQQQQFMQAMQQQAAFGGMSFNSMGMGMGMGGGLMSGQLQSGQQQQQQFQGGTVGMGMGGGASPAYLQHAQGGAQSQGATMGMQQMYPNQQQGGDLGQYGANAGASFYGFPAHPNQQHQQF